MSPDFLWNFFSSHLMLLGRHSVISSLFDTHMRKKKSLFQRQTRRSPVLPPSYLNYFPANEMMIMWVFLSHSFDTDMLFSHVLINVFILCVCRKHQTTDFVQARCGWTRSPQKSCCIGRLFLPPKSLWQFFSSTFVELLSRKWHDCAPRKWFGVTRNRQDYGGLSTHVSVFTLNQDTINHSHHPAKKLWHGSTFNVDRVAKIIFLFTLVACALLKRVSKRESPYALGNERNQFPAMGFVRFSANDSKQEHSWAHSWKGALENGLHDNCVSIDTKLTRIGVKRKTVSELCDEINENTWPFLFAEMVMCAKELCLIFRQRTVSPLLWLEYHSQTKCGCLVPQTKCGFCFYKLRRQIVSWFFSSHVSTQPPQCEPCQFCSH